MTRAWIVDLLSALAIASVVGAMVLVSGGPFWAAAGFGWIVYLAHPPRAQRRAR